MRTVGLEIHGRPKSKPRPKPEPKPETKDGE